jgi:hypothetical protein
MVLLCVMSKDVDVLDLIARNVVAIEMLADR